MKVKVSHTINLEDVPTLVQEILASVKQNVSSCTSRLNFNPNDFDKMVTDCRAFREKLDLIDDQLEDVINITAGWIQATQPNPDEEPALGEEEIVDEEQV